MNGKYNNKIAYLFLAPLLISWLVFMVYPTIRGLGYSFFEWNGLTTPEFIWFENFLKLASDEKFLTSAVNSLILTITVVSVSTVFGFLLAVIIERRVKGWQVYKFIWFLPVLLSQTIVGKLWSKILDPNVGALNVTLRKLGLDIFARDWLVEKWLVLFVICGIIIWQYSGFYMLILLTSMEGIDPEVHNAATIDGVNTYQRMRWIIYPLIKPTIIVVIFVEVIWTLRVFDVVWAVTRGGPVYRSSVFSVYLYEVGFRVLTKFGYASAIGAVIFILLLIISIIYFRVTKANSDIN